MDDPYKGDTGAPCMDIYKAKIQLYGILDELKLIIVVRGDLNNKEISGDTWAPTA